MTTELELLRWARPLHDETVGPLWRRLCLVTLGEEDGEPDEVLYRLGRQGGNTLVNVVRRHGVGYAEVAHNVARELKGLLERATIPRDDVAACEAFVLRKMGIDDAELDQLLQAASRPVEGQALVACAKSAAVSVATDAAVSRLASPAAQAARQVSQQTTRKAAAAAARSAARRGGERAAELAAKHALRQSLARLLLPLNALWAAWAVVDIAGPAFRKTIPAVTYIALLRRIHDARLAA